MNKKVKIIGCLMAVVFMVSVCTRVSMMREENGFEFEVRPETFEIFLVKDGVKEPVSSPMEKQEVENFKSNHTGASWEYPEKQIEVVLEKSEQSINVKITSLASEKNTFTWPYIEGENYILPLFGGKYIPSGDTNWKNYLHGNEVSTIENLSMAFFAVEQQKHNVTYILEENYNNTLLFDAEDGIKFELKHEFPTINPEKVYGLKIYLTEKDVTASAKVYRGYMIEKGQFKTLKQKEIENPNIAKLYGAPFIYLGDSAILSVEDVNWEEFYQQRDSDVFDHIISLHQNSVEDGADIAQNLQSVRTGTELPYDYQQQVICNALTNVLRLKEFYNGAVFKNTNQTIDGLLRKGIDNLSEYDLLMLNKNLLYENMPGVFSDINSWASDRTVDLINDIYNSGIEKAWFGVTDWSYAYAHSEMINQIAQKGYLIGAYDDYHVIHEPGKEEWKTGIFSDCSLFNEAAVTLENGEKAPGFNGVGRKLNPKFGFDELRSRIGGALDTGLPFNSWFVDCDAAGEILDDYTPSHPTTIKEDIEARLKRLSIVGGEYGLVVGSEGGSDYAATSIAFAHGLDLPAFSWMDEDMNQNRHSEYYVGNYYSPVMGVPEVFTKPVPVKDEYRAIFLDPAYNIPLYRLVYNDSVITSYHWTWPSLKIEDEILNRMMSAVLYNTAPLYHLDKFEWEKNKDIITEQVKLYSQYGESVSNLEMTDFKFLSADRLVQKTEFGNGTVKVVANFSNAPFEFGSKIVAANSLIIVSGSEETQYPKQEPELSY